MQKFPSKQPYEAYYVAFNFAARLGVATISTAVVTVMDDAIPPVDVTDILTIPEDQNIIDPSVNTWVQAGVNGRTYTLTCKIVSSIGEKHELEGSMLVLEK